jgi:hypothetical protein
MISITIMKKHLNLVVAVLFGLTAVMARSQPRPPTGPSFDGAMEKLFGDNAGFSAALEFQTSGNGKDATVSGKMMHVVGKSRVEMDIGSMQGIPPQAAAHMKQMGLSKAVMINRTDKDVSYTLYPDAHAYMEVPVTQRNAPTSDYKVETTKLGEENLDGHSCVKNKVVVTESGGATHESTVWNATDLKDFPIKIQTNSNNGAEVVMTFKDVKLEKPDDAQFDPPSDFTKYDSMMALMMSKARPGTPH